MLGIKGICCAHRFCSHSLRLIGFVLVLFVRYHILKAAKKSDRVGNGKGSELGTG